MTRLNTKKKSTIAVTMALAVGAMFSAGAAFADGKYYTKFNAHTYYIYANLGTCEAEAGNCYQSNFCGTTLYAREDVMNLIADALKRNDDVRVLQTSNSQVVCTLSM